MQHIDALLTCPACGATPLVEPTRKLWQVDLYCWHYDRLHGSCELDAVNLADLSANRAMPADHTAWRPSEPDAFNYVHAVRWLRMRFFNLALIGMRWGTPLIIMIADTVLAYTVVSSISSGLLAQWYRVAEVVEWSDMVRRIEDSVRLLNTRVLADRRKLDEADRLHAERGFVSAKPNGADTLR